MLVLSEQTPGAAAVDALRTDALHYAQSHGILMRPAAAGDGGGGSSSRETAAAVADGIASGAWVSHLPLSLYPTPYPRPAFDAACAAALGFSALYARIADDGPFLADALGRLAEIDGFISKLWTIYAQVREQGTVQADAATGRSEGIRQVEINTIASSFGALSSRIGEMHAYLACSGAYGQLEDGIAGSLVTSESLMELSRALAEAHNAYGAPQAQICFVVQPDERNVFDQRLLQYTLFSETCNYTLKEIYEQGALRPADCALLMPSCVESEALVELSVAYFRTGYTPEDYRCETDWQARSLIERSRAIKCPSVATHLAGSKKIQQLLAQSQVLERFVQSETARSMLSRTFCALYPMDETELGLKGRELAFGHPSGFVLKPQREGGGNNIFGDEIPAFLESIPEFDWPQYILMELISTPSTRNVLVREGIPTEVRVVSELGVFGVILWNAQTGEVRSNRMAGHLLRTKPVQASEGGIAAGWACIDSLQLV